MNNVDENEIIEDVNMNIENNNIQKPTYYDSKINELDQRYNLIMNELSNNYNNGNNENIKTDEKNIEKLQNDFFLLKNDLLNDIGTVSDNVTRYDLEINKVVTQNKKLKKSYDEMKQKNSGSKGFARDTQVLYNQYLMGNFLIGLVAISSVLLYQKYYTTTE